MNLQRLQRLVDVRTLLHRSDERELMQASCEVTERAKACEDLRTQYAELRNSARNGLHEGDVVERACAEADMLHTSFWQAHARFAVERARTSLEQRRIQEQATRTGKEQLQCVLENCVEQERVDAGRKQQAVADDNFLSLRFSPARRSANKASLS